MERCSLTLAPYGKPRMSIAMTNAEIKQLVLGSTTRYITPIKLWLLKIAIPTIYMKIVLSSDSFGQ